MRNWTDSYKKLLKSYWTDSQTVIKDTSGIFSLLLIIKGKFGGWVGLYLLIGGVEAVVGAEEPVLDNLEFVAQEGLGAVVAAEAGWGGVEMVAPQLALRG